MKEAADSDLSVAGPGLAATAIRAGRVDRYLLRVVHVIVGGGNRALLQRVRSISKSIRLVGRRRLSSPGLPR